MKAMEKRHRAAQGCIDRFSGKSYDPAAHRDCAYMVRHALHLLGRRVGQGRLPHYKTDLGGIKALRKMGHANLIEAVDALGLVRIAPLAALPADIIALPSDHPMGALALAVGNGRLLAYVEGHDGAVICDAKEFVCAWRSLDSTGGEQNRLWERDYHLAIAEHDLRYGDIEGDGG
jgi:hypothetical protein